MIPSDTDRIITIKEVSDCSFISNLIDVGVAALIVYDYLLTVRRESRLFWTRRVNAASVLFFTKRYFALLYYVVLVYYRSVRASYKPTSQAPSLTLATNPLLGTLFIRGGQIIADAVVIGVTWKATYHARSEGSMSFLTRVMFRNGTTYFIILLGLNVLHIVSIFVPVRDIPTLSYDSRILVLMCTLLQTSFLHIPYTHTAYPRAHSRRRITAILISHFILDLHETNQAMSRQDDDDDDLSGVQVMGTDIGQLTSEDSMTEQVEVWAVDLSPWRDIRSV
uniref:Homeobox domain-containing protein n=1 Tax=Ganoderma boninense TaxID=34458 RepID=A0A5K1JXB0_9APHY|nr:Homeobox domain-containing protein [Ganoderma boninense]